MERHRRRTTAFAIGSVAAVVIVLAGLAFAPWRLFVDTEVRDADPFASGATAPNSSVPTEGTTPSTTAPSATTSSTTTSSTTAPSTTASSTTSVEAAADPTTAPPPTSTDPPSNGPTSNGPTSSVRVGSFRSIAHQTSGDVRVGPTPDGRQVVFLEDLATDNGPDVRVFLSPHPPEGDDSIYGTDELELGPLKGNIGDQTYEVPANIDLSQYQSVVLWCERFSVGFGVAGLANA